jgi:hypothetical protein
MTMMIIQVGVDGTASASAADEVLDLHKYHEHSDESVKQSYKAFLEYCAEAGTLPPEAQAILDEPPENSGATGPGRRGRGADNDPFGEAAARERSEYQIDYEDPCSPKLVNKPPSTKGRNWRAFVDAAAPERSGDEGGLDEPPSGGADEEPDWGQSDRRVTLLSLEERRKAADAAAREANASG